MSGFDDIDFSQFIRDVLEYEQKNSPFFNILKKEETSDVSGPKSFKFTFSRSRFQGSISLSGRDMAEAEETFKLNQRDLSQGFDQLSMNPASTPNMSGRDWTFVYDSGSVNPTNKYEIVHGTIPNQSGRSVRFTMVKYY